jgi:exodeoxyribonuclease VII small subunit
MPKKDTKETISESLEKLEKIVEWFDDQERVQVEEGLTKVKEGAVLIKDLRSRLKDVENEFEELKKDLDREEESA